jgi:hypothetical protein
VVGPDLTHIGVAADISSSLMVCCIVVRMIPEVPMVVDKKK